MESSLTKIVFRWERERWQPQAALLCAAGVAILVVGAVLLGHPEWGILGGLGGLYTGMASYGGVQPARIRRMLAVAFSTASITLLGSVVSPSIFATVATVMVVSFLLAALSTKSQDASTVAVQATGVLIVLSGLPELAREPWGNAGLVLAGGLVQTLLQSLVGPAQPYYAERRATADAFRSLSTFLDGLTGGDAGSLIPDAQPFQNARDRLEESIRYGLAEKTATLRHVVKAAETMRATLVGFARTYLALEDRAWANQVARSFSGAFLAVGDSIEHGRYHLHIRPIWPGRTDLEDGEKEFEYWAELLAAAFEDLCAPPSESDAVQDSESSKPPGFRQRTRDFFAWILDSRAVRRLAVGHGLRYAITLGLATAFYRIEGIAHGYWFPLTIAIVLRPDYATTLTRGVARMIGTVAGVVFSTLILMTLHLSAPEMIGIMLIATWLAFVCFQVSYLAYSFALTLFVVFSLAAVGAHGDAVGIARLEATGLGIGTTLLAAWIWPIWQSANVNGVLKEAFQAQVDYVDAVRAMFETGNHELADRMRYRGRTLRIEAERIVLAATLEPRWSHRGRLKSAKEDLAKLDESAAVLLSIHAEASDGKERDKSKALERLVRAGGVSVAMRDRLAGE